MDVEIQDALEGQTDVYTADIQILDKQIEEYLGKIQKTNNIGEIEEYRNVISETLIKKAKIAGEKSPAGSYISNLIEKRRKYEEELNNGQEYIKAETSGLVSYRIDGLEEILSPNNFDNINEKLLLGYNLKTGQIIPASKEAGKIVNNYVSYIVVFLDSEEARNAKEGKTTVTLRLSDTKEVNAQLVYKRQEEDKIMLIFKINKSVEDLIAYRKISLDVVWWSYSGLKVPNAALTQEDEKYYVTRNRTGYKDKILVKVLKQNKTYSIIENYKSEELKELGYSQEYINSRKSITIYDEISLGKD